MKHVTFLTVGVLYQGRAAAEQKIDETVTRIQNQEPIKAAALR